MIVTLPLVLEFLYTIAFISAIEVVVNDLIRIESGKVTC